MRTTELQELNDALVKEIKRLNRRLTLVNKGRTFWRKEAKSHGSPYRYHSEYLAKTGQFWKTYNEEKVV